MRSSNERDIVEELIIVLRVALRRVTFRTYVQAEVVNDHVREVRELLRNCVTLHKTGIRQAEIVCETWGGRPGVRKNDLAAVRGDVAGELRERRVRVDIWASLTIVKQPSAELVMAGVQIGVDIEVVLSKEVGRSRLDRSDGNAYSADDFGGSVRHWRRWELLQDISHRVARREAIQQCQTLRRGRLLLD